MNENGQVGDSLPFRRLIKKTRTIAFHLLRFICQAHRRTSSGDSKLADNKIIRCTLVELHRRSQLTKALNKLHYSRISLILRIHNY
jgi:hypothetical protein